MDVDDDDDDDVGDDDEDDERRSRDHQHHACGQYTKCRELPPNSSHHRFARFMRALSGRDRFVPRSGSGADDNGTEWWWYLWWSVFLCVCVLDGFVVVVVIAINRTNRNKRVYLERKLFSTKT